MAGLWTTDQGVYFTRLGSRRPVPKSAPAVSTATINWTLPELTSDIDAEARDDGVLNATLPSPIAALAAQSRDDSVLAATLPSPTMALTAEVANEGTLAAQLPQTKASLVAEARADSVLAATLPEPQLGLAVEASTAGVLALTLPELTAALAAEARTGGALDLVLPSTTAALTVQARLEAVLAATLPETQVALTAVVITGEQLINWVLPELTASFTAEASAEATVNGQLPQSQMNLQIEEIAEASVNLVLPSPTLELVLVAQVLGDGFIDWELPALDMMSSRRMKVMSELTRQRRVTREFIMASPTQVTLNPQTDVKGASGAVSTVTGVARAVQTFRLIQMSHMERPVRNSVGESQGVMRKYDFTILGEWDAVIVENDWWVDGNGQKWIVDAIVPYNGYERKGLVTSYGRRP